jgi:hypothetical protein
MSIRPRIDERCACPFLFVPVVQRFLPFTVLYQGSHTAIIGNFEVISWFNIMDPVFVEIGVIAQDRFFALTGYGR